MRSGAQELPGQGPKAYLRASEGARGGEPFQEELGQQRVVGGVVDHLGPPSRHLAHTDGGAGQVGGQGSWWPGTQHHLVSGRLTALARFHDQKVEVGSVGAGREQGVPALDTDRSDRDAFAGEPALPGQPHCQEFFELGHQIGRFPFPLSPRPE